MGRECAQSGRTLLLTGWLREVCRKKRDKFYQRGRAYIEIVRGSVKLFIAFPFCSTCHLPLSCQFLGFAVFSFSMAFFELFYGFGSFNCASFDLESEIQTL
jgi:hypothetical protein